MASFMWCCLFKVLILVSYFLICIESKSQLMSLNEDNWDLMLNGEWMVEFYAPWCPACKALQSSWEEFSGWSKDLNIKVGQVDVTASPGLSGRFMVTALPTIFHVLNGEFRQYRGARDKESFISFIEEDKWKSVDAIPGWKSPASFQMSVVSYFFKMSQLLRDLQIATKKAVHTRLMEDYGLPTWGSYLIFAVATIIIGALLGLVAVCTIDLFFPPKSMSPPSVKQKHKEKEMEIEESDDDVVVEDDIVDENTADSSPVRKRKARKAD
ncbi:thioredoxin-related transmembrane protein 1-like isoform X2 [Homalodisca vitripennis]|uniref:thioredoxin-related transmembrane protein 1-like isoform X2 n=1 Tax=Homalodisca vitripennis TaxID=197043 RepID=UPI001EEAF62A|nr:thioredoxin-related transmembrane protein 1-like isoform X2 [Homalodisca vitripennis]